jgi:hypothetical protein
MKPPRIIKHVIYALVVILSLAAVWLVLNAPANFLNARAVYQGF